MELETARLRLRRWRPEDRPLLYAINAEPEVDTGGLDGLAHRAFEAGLVEQHRGRPTRRGRRRRDEPDEDLVVGRAFLIIWPPAKTGGL